MQIFIDQSMTTSTFKKEFERQQNDFRTHGDESLFSYKGYRCRIARCRGHWCGYVTLKGQARYNDLSAFDSKYIVHGGITYVNPLNDEEVTIGFDCGHVYDFSSVSEEDERYYHGEIFQSFDYVKSELEKLVDQIITETL